MQPVDLLMVNEGPSTFYTDSFRNTVEDFMTVFRQSSTTQTMTVDPGTTERFDYDLYGLLTFLRIPPQFHFAIMRCNKLNSSEEYRSTTTDLLVPDTTELNRLNQTNNSTTVNNT
ncbi:MAG: hypothetical protein P4L77_10940 [Sulfuriferula sp.]|nr:hypothetical protein [Sulfuriferula sp.]